MSKLSVKKPFTVLVSVFVVLILGFVSLSRMQLDLLPQINLPYLLIITTYPGASPEKVEAQVSAPLESGLGTITGVKNVVSFSNENYSLVELEFEDDTNMDSVLVKVSSALDNIKSYLPEECGVPNIMEISADMMATMYVAASYEGKDAEELSRFVENTLTSRLERLNGVASVSTTGLVEKTLQVQLNQDKIDILNDKILAVANDALAEAMEQLDDARKKLEDGQKELNDGKAEFKKGQKELDNAKADLQKGKEDLEKEANDTYSKLAEASLALDQLAAHQTTLLNQQTQETVLKTAIEKAKEGITEGEGGVTALTALKATIDTAFYDVSGSDYVLKNNAAVPPTPVVFDPCVLPGAPAGVTNLEYTIGALQTLKIDTAALISAATEYGTAAAALQAAYADFTSDPTDLLKAAALATATDNLAAADIALATAIHDTSAGIPAVITEINKQLDTAKQLKADYESELTAVQLELEVTKGIVNGYESKLKELGVNYQDIEAAKMQAAAGFGMGQAQISAGESALESAQKQLDSTKDTLENAQTQIDDGWESYYDALAEFEKQKEKALKSANADQLLTLSTLSSLIYAQNFEMPAGYIDDKDDNSWLLKVGENYSSVSDIESMVLVHIDDVGDVKLSDVAELVIIDNSMDSYAKLNNEKAIILSIFKASTSGTNEVSKVLKAEIKNLEEEFDGLNILVMMDQGDYIDIIVSSVVESMALGAALAIIILAFFLKDFMPTIVVAISIPLSVLISLIAMYFSNISLNMMSLSGMALGIGMLVDNSIVVIENIYRLRGRGVGAPRAAVQGTKQVAGAVIASTLTSVCVFFPMVYTTGMVRDLMLPMSLTIIYCLLASLLVAMTVVPAASSTLLRNTKPKNHPLFDKIQNVYGKVLGYFLKVKLVPLAIAILLLAFSVWQVFRMGIVMIPEMTGSQIQGNVTFDEEQYTREEVYSIVDDLIYECTEIDGVDSVGVMMGGSTALVASTSSTSYKNFTFMITTEDKNAGAAEVKAICKSIEDIAASHSLDISIQAGMGEMGDLLGSGVSIKIYGQDTDTLLSISKDLMDIVESVEGYTEITNGQEDADQVLHLYIDKDYAMSKGLTVAQIYQTIATEMTTTKSSISVNIDGVDMAVEVLDELDPVTFENLMDITFETTEKDEDGNTETVERTLKEFAEIKVEDGFNRISRENQTRYMSVTASVKDGYNNALISRELEPLIKAYDCPEGYTIDMGGENEAVNTMIKQMSLIILMGVAFIYFVMVAQFQSLLSPFIVLFTLPLAFTGGLLALWITGETISMMALMGFVVLIGTVVNNGIVYVDYTNQLRMGGMERHDALIATGKTRMRPILMTALTTILAESSLIFGDDMGTQMGRGMALVIAGGLLYATLMTLFIIPVMYDIFFKKQPLNVDIGSENLDDVPDDAKEFMEALKLEKEEKAKQEESSEEVEE